MPTLDATLHRTLAAHPAQRYWVALSGGLDSSVLLHVLAALQLPQPVLAVHVHHGLSPNADAWQRHCEQLCQRLRIPLEAREVTVEPAGKGLEDAAREARYRVFADCLESGDVLLTAHHADDQAETLLLRLLRGTGPQGLAGMAVERPLGRGRLLRPMLELTREDLHAYALAQGLDWIDDESNADIHYDRNYLRRQIMPLLQSRWPGFAHRWQSSAALCAESNTLLEELAAHDLSAAAPRRERMGWSLERAALLQLSEARRRNLLRHWLRQLHLKAPEQVHLREVEEQLLAGRDDASAEVSWGDVVMCRFRDRVFALPAVDRQTLVPGPESLPLPTPLPAELALPTGRLRFEFCDAATGPGWLRADLPDFQVRWRRGGERCRPQGRAHSQTLKKLLQEAALEPWLRDALPLIYSGDTLVAAGDLWVCETFAAEDGHAGIKIRWELS